MGVRHGDQAKFASHRRGGKPESLTVGLDGNRQDRVRASGFWRRLVRILARPHRLGGMLTVWHF